MTLCKRFSIVASVCVSDAIVHVRVCVLTFLFLQILVSVYYYCTIHVLEINYYTHKDYERLNSGIGDGYIDDGDNYVKCFG